MSTHEVNKKNGAVAKKLRDLLRDLDVTQAELARLLGRDSNVVATRWLPGDSAPGALDSLLLAGLSRTPDDRQFWLTNSGLEPEQFHLIRKAIHPEDIGVPVISDILTSPRDEYEVVAGGMLRAVIKARAREKK